MENITKFQIDKHIILIYLLRTVDCYYINNLPILKNDISKIEFNIDELVFNNGEFLQNVIKGFSYCCRNNKYIEVKWLNKITKEEKPNLCGKKCNHKKIYDFLISPKYKNTKEKILDYIHKDDGLVYLDCCSRNNELMNGSMVSLLYNIGLGYDNIFEKEYTLIEKKNNEIKYKIFNSVSIIKNNDYFVVKKKEENFSFTNLYLKEDLSDIFQEDPSDFYAKKKYIIIKLMQEKIFLTKVKLESIIFEDIYKQTNIKADLKILEYTSKIINKINWSNIKLDSKLFVDITESINKNIWMNDKSESKLFEYMF